MHQIKLKFHITQKVKYPVIMVIFIIKEDQEKNETN